MLHPPMDGIGGQQHFIVAANLRIAIYLELVDYWKNEGNHSQADTDQRNLVKFIKECLEWLCILNTLWEIWNGRRFTNLYHPYTSIFDNYYYYFDGERYEVDPNLEKAEQQRRMHIESEYEKLEVKIVEPTNEVIDVWIELKDKLSFNLFKDKFVKEEITLKEATLEAHRIGQKDWNVKLPTK
jgi:hypothetical protein